MLSLPKLIGLALCISNLMSAADLTGVDIGAPTNSGRTTIAADRFVVEGGGIGMGGRKDACHFAWLQQTGDFDVRVRVESLIAFDLFARAGLMVRENLEPGGRFAAVLATPSAAGTTFQAREVPESPSRSSGGSLSAFPNAWLRLRRSGDSVVGAMSEDGQRWTQLGSATLDGIESPAYVGLAVTAWQSNGVATAVFRDFGPASGDMAPRTTPAVELPGPSTRRTGLVISEIMYHPSGRADGRSLEFVEVFNSQSIPEDLSGFRLSGAVDFEFPAGSLLAPGGFVVVARSLDDFRAVHSLSNVIGGFTNRLDNAGGTIRLENRVGAVLLEARYDNRPPWPAAPDGAGHSLVLVRPSFGESDPRAWAASALKGGSPGRWDAPTASALDHVRINELVANTDGPDLDFIELYNHSTRPVDLSGAFLSDDPDTNKFRIPDNTTIPAGGFLAFDQTHLGFGLSEEGETVYLTSPDNARVIDGVRFGPQAPGASLGRFPDGAPALRRLDRLSPGQPNGRPWLSQVGISEIMYHPINGDDLEFVELHNRGAQAVDLSGWRLTDAVAFDFPPRTLLAAGDFLVVARNAARLRAAHRHLDSVNCVGDFEGTLSDGGERLALEQPMVFVRTNRSGTLTTNFAHAIVSEVSYSDGGRWGQWSDGGGSSLELRDPRSDPTLAVNWADSDETAKGEWTAIEHTGVLELGDTRALLDQVQILLEGIGECLVDNIEVIGPGGTNLVSNGDFERGLTNWVSQGSHKGSTLSETGGVGNSACLHLRAESRGDPGANRIRATMARQVRPGDPATLRAQVRWLRGHPEFLMRLRGNHLEAFGRLNTTEQLGTPGKPNSRQIPNAPPAIHDVVHSPILPATNQAVVVTARVDDPDGVASVRLMYRLDPSTNVVEVPMNDDGHDGDGVEKDGIWSATVPGQPANVMVAFHVIASDSASHASTSSFPADAPVRECLVRFGEPQLPSTFGTYRIWMTAATRNTWARREKLNNAPLDVTFVYGDQRVIYNALSLYAGSPFVSTGYDGPTGTLCGYVVRFPSDDRFLGAEDMNLDWPARDSSLQLEQVAYWIADQLGLPRNYRRFVHLYVNGQRRGQIYEDTQQPNGDLVSQYFPDDAEGDLYKIEDWFEFDNSASGFSNTDATLDSFVGADGALKLARYRWNWRRRAIKDSANDYRSLFALVNAVETSDPRRFAQQMEEMVDLRQFLGIIAVEHLVGNWDSFGFQRGKNMYAYKPRNGKWSLLMWDIDFVLGANSDAPQGYLYYTIDPTVNRMFFTPALRRAYQQVIAEAINGPLQPARHTPLLQANQAALQANGVNPGSYRNGADFLSARLRYASNELAEARIPFGLDVAGSTVTVSNNLWILTGRAPLRVERIEIGGVEYPIEWMTPTNWLMRVPLSDATNRLQLVARDAQGQIVAGGNRTLTVRYRGAVESPLGQVIFSEVMHHPSIPGAEYVELRNISASFTFDLSGWRIQGLDYVFPAGAILEPGAHFVLARDRDPFLLAYGKDFFPNDTFAGSLDPSGETLRLIRPGARPAEDLIVAELVYASDAPWPDAANRGGIALQRIDPRQAPNRIGNWAAREQAVPEEWQFVSTTGTATDQRLLLYLSGFPPFETATNIAGTWDGYVDLGAQGRPTFEVEIRSDAAGWSGEFIFDRINPQGRFPLTAVSYSSNQLAFSLGGQVPEFKFTLTADGLSMRGTYQPPQQPSATAGLTRQNPGGDVYIDDLRLVAGTDPDGGLNLVRNGDFELSLSGTWTVPTNHAPSEIVTNFARSGTSSLHLIARQGGADTQSAVWQEIDGLLPGQTYTLSYWLRRGGAGQGVVVRLEDRSLHTARSIVPAPIKPAAYTPGDLNAVDAELPEFPALWLNEFQAINATGPADASGEREPWVELFNAGTNAIALGEFFLSDTLANLGRWRFPQDATIAPGQFRLIWLDAEAQETTAADWHANFRTTTGRGLVLLSRPLASGPQIVDYVAYDNLPPDASIGWAIDGVAERRQSQPRATPAQPNAQAPALPVVINEWMASNSRTILDPADNDAEDWFELFNPGAQEADLEGYLLSDEPALPAKFIIPAGVRIPPGHFLLVWADNEPGQNRPGGALHVNFRLGAQRDAIVLSAPDGSLIDAVDFASQATDISEGRFPDGVSASHRTLTAPTPGGPNRWLTEVRITSLQWSSVGRLRLTVETVNGQRYLLQSTSVIDAATWENVGSALTADGSPLEWSIAVAPDESAQRYYRVVREP